MEVGVPVLMVAEEEADVGDFEDFVVVEAKEVVEEAVRPVVEVAAAPGPPPQPVTPAPTALAPESVANAVAIPVVAEMTATPLSSSWGDLVRVQSELTTTSKAPSLIRSA